MRRGIRLVTVSHEPRFAGERSIHLDIEDHVAANLLAPNEFLAFSALLHVQVVSFGESRPCLLHFLFDCLCS